MAPTPPADSWLVAAWLHARSPRLGPLPWMVGLTTRSDAQLQVQLGRRAACQRILPKGQLMLQLESLLAQLEHTAPPSPPPITDPHILSALAMLPPRLTP